MNGQHVTDALHLSDERASKEGYVVVYSGGVRHEVPAKDFFRQSEQG